MFFLNKKIKIAVHSGGFHPDDVFSVALLSILFNENIKIIRTREKEIYSKSDFIVDVGLEYNPDNNKFDHHQDGGAGKRENGINYSSFGLLWKSFGEKVCGSKKVADTIDNKLVQIIDADDTAFDLYNLKLKDTYPFAVTDIIYSLHLTWKEPQKTNDEAFTEAVDIAKKVLSREIKVANDKMCAEVLIDDIYKKTEDKRIVVLENNFLPKSLIVNYPEPLFVIYKEKEGSTWRVNAIRKNEQGFEVRKKFPNVWSCMGGEELIAITGVEDASFCHFSCVYAGAKSKEGAIKLAKLALKEGPGGI